VCVYVCVCDSPSGNKQSTVLHHSTCRVPGVACEGLFGDPRFGRRGFALLGVHICEDGPKCNNTYCFRARKAASLHCLYMQDMLHDAEAHVRQAGETLRQIYEDENSDLVGACCQCVFLWDGMGWDGMGWDGMGTG